jgi:DNA polymerase-3 subunit beta
MKCIVRKGDLENIVTKAARASDPKSPVALVQNIMISVSASNRIRATGCDVYVAWEGDTDAVVERPGVTTVPAEDLAAKVKGLPEGSVSIELGDDGKLSIRAKARKHLLPTIDAEKFPRAPSDQSEPRVFEIGARAMKAALDRVYRVIDKKADPHFACAHLWAESGVLYVVAAHNHRSHWQSFQMPEIPDITQATMIPPKAIEDLRALLTVDEKVIVTIGKTWMSVRSENGHTYRTRLQLWEAKTPFHRTLQYIRSSLKHPVKVPRALALEAFAACASDAGRLALHFKPGRIICESQTDDGKLSEDEIPIDASIPERSLTIDQRYAIELFQAAPDAFVDVEPQYLPGGLSFNETGTEDRKNAHLMNDGIGVALALRSGDFEGVVMAMGEK